MREAAFVKRNLERWQEFEKILDRKEVADPDKIAELFIQVTDDLAFSRTQYPESHTTHYLNGLATRIHSEIYKNKREDKSRFITFWMYEVPMIIGSEHKKLLYALIIFVLSALIGVISQNHDDSFARLILGDGYVNMTLNNIEKGDPLAVYKSGAEIDSFFAITFNNVKVSFNTFISGLFFSIGTGFLLFMNGIMVGTFFTFLAQQNFLMDSLLIVMMHGTLELSAIVIAGAAGFVLGNSFLFPGTYSRLDSFKIGAKKGLKIIMGLVPVFIIAGFIESFITRYTQAHWIFKVMIILVSAFFIIYYYIYNPIKLKKNERIQSNQIPENPKIRR